MPSLWRWKRRRASAISIASVVLPDPGAPLISTSSAAAPVVGRVIAMFANDVPGHRAAGDSARMDGESLAAGRWERVAERDAPSLVRFAHPTLPRRALAHDIAWSSACPPPWSGHPPDI